MTLLSSTSTTARPALKVERMPPTFCPRYYAPMPCDECPAPAVYRVDHPWIGGGGDYTYTCATHTPGPVL